ncbi:hypothetical protein [Pseudonocardia sp. NPDC049154]|uniref:hypothetical protein n=1 Tax=Pseudonocardia sp. NPDC049154 TaxID=3155501 RepID=UPI0033EB85F8
MTSLHETAHENVAEETATGGARPPPAPRSRAERAGQEALDAVRSELPMVLSYSAPTLDADLDPARGVVTGTFAEQFDQVAASVIAPQTRSAMITTSATVNRAGLAQARRTASTRWCSWTRPRPPGTRPSRVTQSQVRVVLLPVEGRWLISEVSPL